MTTFLEPIQSFLRRYNIPNYKEKEINIDKKFFEFSDYLEYKKMFIIMILLALL